MIAKESVAEHRTTPARRRLGRPVGRARPSSTTRPRPHRVPEPAHARCRQHAQPQPQPPAQAPAQRPAAAKPAPGSDDFKVARMVTIALDPGHGGEDPGATGATGAHEKDIVLAIAKRLKDKLEQLPNTRVMLTRDADFFVPLGQRVDKARKVQADLFVSVHADAFVEPSARGSSVFVLSEKGASSSAARWLAADQNKADLIGGVNLATHDKRTGQRAVRPVDHGPDQRQHEAGQGRADARSAASTACTAARSSRPASPC